MTTTPQDKLTKLRWQIEQARKYVADNPHWQHAKTILDDLLKRERILLDEILSATRRDTENS